MSEAISAMFRPAVFAWPFWAALAATYARQAFDFFGEGGRFALGLVTLSALVIAAAWTVLPWEAGASARGKLAVPVFLLAVFVFSQVTGSVWALILYLISFSNAVFVFGPRKGIVYGAVVAAVVFADGVSHAQGIGLKEAALSSFALVPLVLLVVGACAAIVATVREREDARALLGELEKAHAELEEYAARVRTLSISEERARLSREMAALRSTPTPGASSKST